MLGPYFSKHFNHFQFNTDPISDEIAMTQGELKCLALGQQTWMGQTHLTASLPSPSPSPSPHLSLQYQPFSPRHLQISDFFFFFLTYFVHLFLSIS